MSFTTHESVSDVARDTLLADAKVTIERVQSEERCE
jgi:hypothetical protein